MWIWLIIIAALALFGMVVGKCINFGTRDD